ncbi:unnamed protein product [Hymenolepis diminuta]|uniref:Reverse transcriptase domain-containing protein n=1 Tax=Hymenolepis diminuta TaxID=6216 RepID=A0A564YV72_HYMDI|nr:unnamed protein product [Hymenolepis diminuta]
MWKDDGAHANPTLAHAVRMPRGLLGRASYLAIRHCIQLAIDKDKPIVLIFVDLKKAFDSLPTHVIIKRLIDLRFSWNIVHSIFALLDSPVGRLRGSTESFIMERGVRQGSKEGLLLFNITFQLVLEEVFNLADEMGITLITTRGDEWRLSHLEYADDLCLIANTIAETEGLLQRLDTVLTKWQLTRPNGCAWEWNRSGSYFTLEVKALRESTRDATEAISRGIANGRRQLMKIGPILRSSVLAVKAKAHLVDTFVSPAIYYGLSTVVLRVRDKKRISALLNTARRVILGLNSRRTLRTEKLAKRVSLKCPAAIIQRRRLSLWIGLSGQKRGLTKRLLESCLRDNADKKRAHTKCWMRRLQADAKELFSGDAEDWLANPCRSEKGIRNHGYEKHNWLVARSAPLGEGRRRRTTKP